MRATLPLLATILIAAGEAQPTVPPGQTRSAKALAGGPMRYFPERSDQATVVAATFLGGPGHEFLVDGGFQADGTVVLAGNVVGEQFALGVRETVIGSDGARPGPAVFGPELKDGKPQAGTTQRPSWTNPGATGFVVRCTADLRAVSAVARMPWGAGAITAAEIAPDGAIYIAGRAGAGIRQLGGDVAELAVPAEAARKGPAGCDATFIARLGKDATRAEWVRVARGASDAPRLSLTRDGAVCLLAQDVRVFSADGRQRSLAVVPGGVRETTSVSPIDGTIVKGGEHHWPTGRQPWRCPTLNTYTPDGTLQYQLYDWGGPYVVLDGLFAVSDTAVRMVAHDREGRVVLVLWSDGGNSCAYAHPNDIRTRIGGRGLGLSGAGANATSFAYLVRLDPADYRADGMALWCSSYAGKGNGASIRAVAQADDGAIAFAGSSAWGLHQTVNKLADGEPAGEYIAVATGGLDGVRFSSAVPGVGAAIVGNDGDVWGIGTGSVQGRGKVLFLAGAAADGEVYGLRTPTPVANAVQGRFGGGLSDGYVVLLDLGPPAPAAAATAAAPRPRLSIDAHARAAGGKPGRGDIEATDGERFRFDPAFPKWTTVDAEFRDAQGRYWPNFAYGKPVSGELVWKGGRPSGAFTVACPNWCQPKGDQGRRVLGGLFTDGKPPALALTVSSLGALRSDELMVADDKGRSQARVLTWCEAEAVLEIAGRKLPCRPRCAVKTALVNESSIRKTAIQAYLTVKGREIGLSGDLADAEIDIRIGMAGHAGEAPARR